MSLGIKIIMRTISNELFGDDDTGRIISENIGKKIAGLSLSDNALHFVFDDGAKIKIYDDGQNCCEERYMATDDDLPYFVGAVLNGIKIKDAPNIEDEYGEHEIQFLEVLTSKGTFVMANHNEHNGYYGGFWVVAEYEE